MSEGPKPRPMAERSVLPWAVRDHCAKGHRYIDDNLYVKPNGERCCRICKRAHDRNRSKRQREVA